MKWIFMRSIATIVVFLCAMRTAADEPLVRIVPEGDDPTRVVVACRVSPEANAALLGRTISEAEGQRYLSLSWVDEATGEAGPPIFAKYEFADARLTLRPAFGLVRGATYRATAFDGARERPLGTIEYRVPALESRLPPRVTSMKPSGRQLPANVLRFYLTFSCPMREGREVLEQIKLFDEAGREIEAPWRDIELWNADATRLSLFLHPGRIKRGVNLREQFGPLLLPNRKYAIVIGRELRDAEGTPLGRDVRYEFSTTAEVRTRIDVGAWRISPPWAGSRQPLRIEFDRDLDAALALRLIRIRDFEGKEIHVWKQLDDHERTLIVTGGIWENKPYFVEADPTLEDQAGNTPVRVFDTDLAEPKVEVLPPQLRREFKPK